MIETPIGPVTVFVDGDVVVEIVFGKTPWSKAGQGAASTPGPIVNEAEQQLRAYFAKKLTRFDLPLGALGSAFQQRVWTALVDVKHGTTTSYAALAKTVGSPSARAVGRANGTNPIAIVVPCHRVIGKNGDLTGYGGGLPRKRWLLVHEGAALL